MASPFSLFRKYMKPMMVALCGMAILAFVVADPLMQYMGGSAGGSGRSDGSQVVVEWKEGKLTERELSELVYRRRLLMKFLEAIERNGRYFAFQDGLESLPLSVPFPNLPTEYSQQVESDVVGSQIIVDKARKMGMAVSDDAVREYLDKIGRNRVSFEEMNLIVKNLFGGRQGVTSQYILDIVRDELLKQNFLASYVLSNATQLPEQQYGNWLQLNDRVVIEAAALKTADFISKTGEPTEAELLAFYDKYKNDEPMPDLQYNLPLPDPAFKVPRKVVVQYLEANFDAEVAKVLPTITEEEIAKYYEANKRLFEKAGSGFFAEPTTETPADTPDSKEAEKELFEVPASESPAENSENPPAEKTEGVEPAAEAPVIPADEPAPSKDEQSNVTPTTSPFRLVALQEPPTEIPPVETDKLADEKSVEGTAPDTATPEIVPPAATGEAPAATPPVAEPLATDTPAPATPLAEKPVEYETLDEVRLDIRASLARMKIANELPEKMQKLRKQLQPAYLNYLDAVVASKKQSPPEPPQELKNLQALAEPNGLTYHETGKLSFWDLRETEIGKSGEDIDSPYRVPTLAQLAFSEDRMKNYQPMLTRDRMSGNQFLAMKTSDDPAYVPSLEDIRDEVVQAWKRQKASELALAEATKLAEEMEKSGQTLGEKFAGDPRVEVVVTDPFSRVTVGDIAPTTQEVSFRLSEPVPIVAAGPDFLKKVFDLREGQVAAVYNHDHSIAYIVRVQKHLESPEELQQNYLSEMASRGWIGERTMFDRNRQLAYEVLIGGLLKDAGIDENSWKRPRDMMRVDASE